MITVMNMRVIKPSKLWDIKIDRSSVLGNPFFMKSETDRDTVCDRYKLRLDRLISNNNQIIIDELNRLISIHAKYGKLNLFCWCAPKRCHGDYVKQVLESMINEKDVCKCGNPEFGFDCVCEWIELRPGNNNYMCEFCGIYKASAPRCNKCEIDL